VPIVLISGILNLLELSGPVQACNGIDLNFKNLMKQNVTSDYKYLEQIILGSGSDMRIKLQLYNQTAA
jgi:formylmethanofuran dehydrogenase subunit B